MSIHNAVETLQNNTESGIELFNKLQSENKLYYVIQEGQNPGVGGGLPSQMV